MALTLRAALTALASRPAESGTTLTGLTLTLRLASARTMTAMSLTVAVRIELAALADGEVGRLAFRYVPLGPRQLRSDERPMHRPIRPVVVAALAFVFGGFRVGVSAFRGGRGGDQLGLFFDVRDVNGLGGFFGFFHFGGVVQRREFFGHVSVFR